MSREERRNYQRMMKDVERGPALPPAAKARAERNAARRAAVREAVGSGTHEFTLGWLIRTFLLAVLIGYLAFSVQWGSGMPFAAYFGIAGGVVGLVVLVVLRIAQRTAAGR